MVVMIDEAWQIRGPRPCFRGDEPPANHLIGLPPPPFPTPTLSFPTFVLRQEQVKFIPSLPARRDWGSQPCSWPALGSRGHSGQAVCLPASNHEHHRPPPSRTTSRGCALTAICQPAGSVLGRCFSNRGHAHLVKMQIWSPEVYRGAGDSTLLASSQATSVMQVQGPRSE